MARIELQGINKSLGTQKALRDLDLVVQDGEFFVLPGRTGAGKTTALRVVAGA
jgi:multiple sugar transport system ATP-binding protein